VSQDSTPARPPVTGETQSGIRNLPCYLASLLEPGPTLVVGASSLGLEAACRARSREFDVYFLDRSRERLGAIARIARERDLEARELLRDIERDQLGIPPRSVSNVLCLDGLEGYRDDVGVLEKLHRVLEPDGRLVVRVAAHPWATRPGHDPEGAVRRFDAELLRDSLEEAGFRPLSLRHWNFLGVPGSFLHERVLRRDAARAHSYHWWDRGIDLWFRAVENRVGFPIGVSLISVATPYFEKAAVASPEPKRVFSSRTAREAYEPMTAGR
jgi:SAM-dependent methyltransferase